MLDRTLAPPFNRSTSFELIPPQKQLLKGGAEAYFILGGTQNVSKVEIIFPAGRWFEKTGGDAYFSANLLSKGTKLKSSFDIAHLLDSYGAHLEINAGLDFVSVSLYVLNKNFEPAILLLIELLTQSVFPEDEFELIKSIYLQNLKVNQEKTSFQASRLLRKNLFDETHPYGKELEEHDVLKLDINSIVEHYNQFFKTATILISGKVSEGQAKIIKEAFSSFGHHTIEPNNFRCGEPFRLQEIVAKEGSVQSTIRMAKKSVGKMHSQYVDVLFLNHILGGYFSSRLMKNIREDKGLSYGISSSLHALKNDSYLVIGADVNRENLNLTFEEIRKELKQLRTEKIEEEELNLARNHFIGSLQLEITTSFAHADKIKNIILFNLSSQHYQNMINRVEAITAENLIEIANQYFSEDTFVEVAVG